MENHCSLLNPLVKAERREEDGDLRLAHRLAQIATVAACSHFRAPTGVSSKADGSRVSDADIAAERAMREVLATERPADGILGEELGSGGSESSSRRWLLDPIDGTDSFLSGGRGWGTHVALEQDGAPIVAVITRPTEGAAWAAVRGGGTKRTSPDGASASILEVADGGPATGRVAGMVDRGSRRRSLLAGRLEWVDDAVSPVAALLEGRIGAVLDEGGEVWDRAPAILLAEEAGARCLGPSGIAGADDPWVLYAVPSIADGLAGLLRGDRG